ncbi:MAG: hypothetical protein ACREX0_15370, partial [Noviherbaspirillum sp.]
IHPSHKKVTNQKLHYRSSNHMSAFEREQIRGFSPQGQLCKKSTFQFGNKIRSQIVTNQALQIKSAGPAGNA